MERKPYTLDELAELVGVAFPAIQCELESVESSYPGARPVPPLSLDESLAFLLGMINNAVQRGVFTADESFFFGQLLNQYTQAVKAAVLMNTTGRYYVIDENDVIRVMESKRRK